MAKNVRAARHIDPYSVLDRPVTLTCAREWLRRFKRASARTTYEDIMFWRAEGDFWYDIAGKEYLNFGAGMLGLNLGGNHHEVRNALAEFIRSDLSGIGACELGNVYAAALAEKLIELTPGKFRQRVFLSNSGGEAVAAAVIAAMLRGFNRKAVLSLSRAFHGRQIGREMTTSRRAHLLVPRANDTEVLFPPVVNPEDPKLAKICNDPELYLAMVKHWLEPRVKNVRIAAMELIQGEGGINTLNRECVKALVEYLQKNNVWIFVDEVQTGLGRTGKMFACEHYGLEPDVLTLGKSTGGGFLPVGITILNDELNYDGPRHHSSTHGGLPQGCFVALHILRILERDKLVDRAAKLGEALTHTIKEKFLAPVPGENWREMMRGYGLKSLPWGYLGIGLMQKIMIDPMVLGEKKANVVRNTICAMCLKSGLYVSSASDFSIRIMPPLNVDERNLTKGLDILADCAEAAYKKLV